MVPTSYTELTDLPRREDTDLRDPTPSGPRRPCLWPRWIHTRELHRTRRVENRRHRILCRRDLLRRSVVNRSSRTGSVSGKWGPPPSSRRSEDDARRNTLLSDSGRVLLPLLLPWGEYHGHYQHPPSVTFPRTHHLCNSVTRRWVIDKPLMWDRVYPISEH